MLEKRTVSQCISSDYCKGWNDAVDEMPKWIRTAKELPHKNELVLAYVHQLGCRPYMLTVRLMESETNKFFVDIYGREVFNVSHWMPLPVPPEAGVDNG